MIEAKIRKAGLDDPKFNDGDKETLIGGYHIQQNPKELAGMIEVLKDFQPINNYLSIGTAAGGTDRFICEELGIKRFYSIDIDTHWQRHIWREVNKPAMPCPVDEYLGDSHLEGAENFLDSCDGFNLIGIDGDHTPCGVRLDWQLIQPYLKPGVIVWFHDIKICQGPMELWETLKKQHKVIYESQIEFGLGVIQI